MVEITSNGLAQELHWEKLGTYTAVGTWNGRITYRNHAGAYLYFGPTNKWMVRIHRQMLINTKYILKLTTFSQNTNMLPFHIGVEKARYLFRIY